MRTDSEGSACVATKTGRSAGLNLDRFWDKVQKRGDDDCWDWQGATKGKGYGAFWLGGRPIRAHRAAYEFEVGRVPKGLQVLHRCNNRLCVNPRHLVLGDNKANMLDMHRDGRGCPRCDRCGRFLRDGRCVFSYCRGRNP